MSKSAANGHGLSTGGGPAGASEMTIAGVRLGPVPDHYGLHNGATAT